MKKTIRKITILLLIAFILIPTVSVGFRSFFIAKGAYALTNNDYDNTNILEDLSELNLDEYKPDKTKDIQLLTFVEYAYPYYSDMKDHYALYVYIYNPKQLNIDVNSRAHNIQMTSIYENSIETTTFDKFELKLITKSTDPYRDLFYKFKIVDRNIDDTYFFDRVDKNNRKYELSSLELKEYGKDKEDHLIGRRFNFSGYAKGYGQDPTKVTLQVSDEDFKPIKLDVDYTYYRTSSSHVGKGYNNEVNTVYFSLDNKHIEDSGKLQRIKAEWYEYKTTPMIITKDQELFDNLYNYLMVNIGNYNSGVKYNLHADYYEANSYWVYNDPLYTVGYKDFRLEWLFKVNSLDQNIREEIIQSAYRTYPEYELLDIPGRQISAALFETYVEEGRTRGYNLKEFDTNDTFDLLSYDSNHNNWDKFFDYWSFKNYDTGEEHYDIVPIYKIEEKDLIGDVAKNLLIAKEDVYKVTSLYNANKLINKSTYLFRFANNIYYSNAITVRDNLADVFVTKDTALVSKMSMFFNFDILTLTFYKDNVYTTIPVVMSPIDIINTTNKPTFDPGTWIDSLKQAFKDMENYFKSMFSNITKTLQTISLLAIIFIIIYLIAKLIGFISNQIYKNQKKDRK